MRNRFDLTPQQYHAGLDKLWNALGVDGPQNEDVFTLAARAIKLDNASRDECKAVINRARARLRQLRIEDPFVYGVKRTLRGKTRYRTQVSGFGWRQLFATDFKHSGLWLTTCRENAETVCQAAIDNYSMPEETWEVFTLPKRVAVKLPCYEHGQYSALQEHVTYVLREAGCKCPEPLLSYQPSVGPRCRLCNIVVD